MKHTCDQPGDARCEACEAFYAPIISELQRRVINELQRKAVFVRVRNDQRLHLSPIEPGFGISAHTLCLERVHKRAEQPFNLETMCPDCREKVREKR